MKDEGSGIKNEGPGTNAERSGRLVRHPSSLIPRPSSTHTAERPSPWYAIFREAPSRGSLTWASAAGAFALYWFYSLVVSPLVAPPSLKGPERARDGGPDVQAELPNLVLARKYLPHVKWAGDAAIQLRSASAIVYAEDWKPIDSDKAVRFTPFAMIWMQQGRKPGEAPITIVSDSAYVRFTNKFKLDVGKMVNPGRVVGGSLEGNVEIRGDNNLRIVGRNFFFSEKVMRIWSDAPLSFAYGPHRGSAHGLQCELLRTKTPPKGDKLAVGGIETVRLRRNVVMDLVFQPGSSKTDPFTGKPAASAKKPNGPPKRPTLVNIHSDGAFEFGVQTNVGEFEENVRVTRPTKPGLNDILLCDQLTLVFEPDESKKQRGKSKAKPAPKKAGDGERFQTLDSNLAFRRMRAQSRDPRRPVILISESNRLKAWMDDLIHDSQLKLTVLRDRGNVRVLQDTSETHAPKITLLQDQRGTISSLWCDGAGWTRHADKRTRRTDFTAVWKKRLRKFPDPQSNLDIVDLEQDVVLTQPLEKSELRSQFVRIWMDRRKKNPGLQNSNSGGAAGVAAQRNPGDPRDRGFPDQPSGGALQPRPPDDGDRNRTRLRRMLALDRVTMTSTEMRAHTRRLQVWFEHADEHPSASPAASRMTAYILPTQLRRRRRQTPFMASVDTFSRDSKSSERSANSDVGRSAPLRKASESRRNGGTEKSNRYGLGRGKDDGPMDVWADLINVRVEQGVRQGPKGAGSRIREAWTKGNVEVRQEHQPREKPLRIHGDRMHIVNRSEQDQIVHVYGRPAHVYDRLTHIQGDRIHLDRGRNVSWVDGKGLLQLPVERTLEGRKLPQPQPLDITWRKSMNFDGVTARFREKVRSVVGDSSIRCEEMDVVLSERVSFIKRAAERKAEGGKRNGQDHSPLTNHQSAKVKTVVCRDNVQFESYEYEADPAGQDVLVQIRKGHVKSFEVDQISGNSHSKGPGWVALWRRGQGKSPRFGAQAAVRPNRAARKSKTTEWNYTKIVFTDGTTGNTKERHNRFRGHVEVVYGPVERPPHVVDADSLPNGGAWMRSRDLVVTQHLAVKGRPAYLTMAASGNAEVDGSSYHGRADTITYDESRDLYILRSVGRRKAMLWRRLRPGTEPDRARSQGMQFIPSKNSLIFDKTSELQGLR
jgi:hypothetical protein